MFFFLSRLAKWFCSLFGVGVRTNSLGRFAVFFIIYINIDVYQLGVFV